MKYPKLTGICKIAIENNLCRGCSKLEDFNFRGQAECELAQKPKKVLEGIQEKIEIWM